MPALTLTIFAVLGRPQQAFLPQCMCLPGKVLLTLPNITKGVEVVRFWGKCRKKKLASFIYKNQQSFHGSLWLFGFSGSNAPPTRYLWYHNNHTFVCARMCIRRPQRKLGGEIGGCKKIVRVIAFLIYTKNTCRDSQPIEPSKIQCVVCEKYSCLPFHLHISLCFCVSFSL